LVQKIEVSFVVFVSPAPETELFPGFAGSSLLHSCEIFPWHNHWFWDYIRVSQFNVDDHAYFQFQCVMGKNILSIFVNIKQKLIERTTFSIPISK
jgi:hypothetical protein